MALNAGTRLGPYEIVSAIGAGGMGEVYRARDTRLDRIVAVKVLPGHVSGDPALRERFEREARTVAALNHPHICTLFDVGHQEGVDFLVMEYLEGETLAQRLAKAGGPHGSLLRLEEALSIAIQIADALDKAHRAGIVHRDLKPGNIMLVGRRGASGTSEVRRGGPSGPPVAKLLDFGLAKVTPAVVAASGFSIAPTLQTPVTAQGTILGTLQYMAPEQIEGQEADARTDIFAFGAVLYEMLTGKKAFEGKSQASLIGAILKDDPPAITSLQPLTPALLDHIVRVCLAKDPDDRWQTARDLLRELQWVAHAPDTAGVTASPTAALPRASRWRRFAAVSSVAIVTALLAGAGVWIVVRPQPPTVERLTIALPPGDEIGSVDFPPLALSPDGTQLVYVGNRQGRRQLFVQRIDSFEPTPLSGTDAAQDPFFSPDGRWVGFFADGKLKKISASAGSLQVICDAPADRGGSWAPDDTIYFAPTNLSGLWKVPASGGAPVQVTALDRSSGEVSHRWPQVLPGGKAVLFTDWLGPGADETQIAVQALDTGERHVIVRGAETGRYVSTGHLVYARGDALMALPLDLRTLRATSSTPVALTEQVHQEGGEGASYAVSESGALAYLAGSPHRSERRLVWVDRSGRNEPLPLPVAAYYNPVLSPDGRQVAVQTAGSTEQISVYDFSRRTLTRLTTAGSSQSPQWTADGSRIVYRGTRKGFRNLFWRPADGSGEEERLTTKENTTQTPGKVSADGRLLPFEELSQKTGSDIWVMHLDGERISEPFVATTASEGTARLSPDDHWLAYHSDGSGRDEVYVTPFPGRERRWQLSTDGGTEPVWSRSGKELFYINGDKLMVVEVITTPTFAAGTPRLIMEGRYTPSPTDSTGYDVSADGQRFIRVQPTEPDPPTNQIRIVMNWFDELQRIGVAK
jgi:serine/threonine protein kinase/Tol biopolymer transport system component